VLSFLELNNEKEIKFKKYNSRDCPGIKRKWIDSLVSIIPKWIRLRILNKFPRISNFYKKVAWKNES
jgi:hypothetical protein